LAKEIFTGRVQTPITIPFTVAVNENGMTVTDEQEHIQFMVNMTFSVNTVAQVQKEKRKVVEVTHSYYIC
jgi:hypothetical protein